MNTKIMTYGLIILGLFGLSGMASAITATVTDGNDNVFFQGENLTIGWTPTGLYSYIWICNDSTPLTTSTFYNGTYGAPVQKLGASSITLNTAALGSGIYWIFINSTDSASFGNASTASSGKYMLLYNYTIAITPDYTKYGVLGGDNATVVITAAGPAVPIGGSASFTVVANESVTPVRLTPNGDYTITYLIPVSGTAGTYGVNVSNGGVTKTGYYAVRSLAVLAADRSANTNVSNNVSLVALDQLGNAGNISTSSGSALSFALVLGKSDDGWGGIAGNSTINVTFAATANSSIVSAILGTGAAGTGSIAASCWNIAKTASTTYAIHGTNSNVTINTYNNGTAASAFNIDKVVSMVGWTNNVSSLIYVNVTNATSQVALLSATPASNGSWTINWNTSDYTIPNLGAYTLIAWQNASTAPTVANVNTSITLSDALALTSANSTRNGVNLANQVYIDDTLVLNGTTSRIDGKKVTVNVTRGTYSSVSTVTVANGLWSSTWTATSNIANGVGAFTVIVNDSDMTTTQPITVIDNLAVTGPANGPIGSSVVIKGTSSRANGTNISLNATVAGFPTNQIPVGAIATVSGGNWSYTWSTVSLPAYTYTITATDAGNLTIATGQVTLGTGTISNVAVTPSTIYLDDTLNITGTTTYPAGTSVNVNITNCSGGVISQSTVTVAADQTFVKAFTPNTAAAAIASKTGIVAGGTVSLCVALNISSASANTFFYVTDNLALTTVSSAVTGDLVLLSGTTSRANGTSITLNVSYNSPIYNLNKTATAVGQSTSFTTGTFSDNTFYATLDGTSSGGALPANTYTITATDGLVTVTKTLNVVTSGAIAITKPTVSQNVIGGPIRIEGTSNRVNGTGLNISITGQNQTTLNTNVNTTGMFNASWNTNGWLSGVYYIKAELAGKEATTISMTYTSTSSTTTTTGGSTTTNNGTTTTTINGTTTTGPTTTTTTPGGCGIVGNAPPCNTVSVPEIISAITSWASGNTTLEQVLALIHAWATGVAN